MHMQDYSESNKKIKSNKLLKPTTEQTNKQTNKYQLTKKKTRW